MLAVIVVRFTIETHNNVSADIKFYLFLPIS